MTALSTRLKMLRESNKLTQSELAKRIGVTTASISKYELGIVVPDVDKLIRYGYIFKVSVDYLVGLSNGLNDTIEPVKYNSDDIEMLELFKQLPDKYKFEIKGYIKGILSSNTVIDTRS